MVGVCLALRPRYPSGHTRVALDRPRWLGMRVLLLDYEYLPLTGGSVSEALARGLASRGVMVDLVASGERASTESSVLWDGASAAEGLLTVHRVKSRAGYLFAALRLLRLLLRGDRY